MGLGNSCQKARDGVVSLQISLGGIYWSSLTGHSQMVTCHCFVNTLIVSQFIQRIFSLTSISDSTSSPNQRHILLRKHPLRHPLPLPLFIQLPLHLPPLLPHTLSPLFAPRRNLRRKLHRSHQHAVRHRTRVWHNRLPISASFAGEVESP